MAAQLITVRLSRGDAQPWGFRLQGGADFGTPLVVQKINAGSLADQAGLMPGDAVIKINDMDIFPLRHKDAQDLVVRSGNTFVMSVQRGGSTWRPHVTATGHLPSHQSHLGSNISTVTRTSLAHKQPQPVEHIGCGYNNAARPFNSINGGDGHVKSIVNKQYNTPVGIYSEEAIAETLSAQAEVLAGGVLGVNFKKNEKEYNPTNSEVLKFLKEEESHPQEPEPYAPANFFWTASHAIGGRKSPGHPKTPTQQTDERVGTPLEQNTLAPTAAHRPSLPQNSPQNKTASAIEPISAPVIPSWKPELQQQSQEEQKQTQSTTEGPITKAGLHKCDNCGIGIVGVFCRIKDKNLHVECFKCATCGTPLKNQGYYNYNNKLYCDIHAKLAALQNPPPGTEGYVPIPIKPTPKLSASNIANALNAHGYNLQTNGATPHLITGPMPSSGNVGSHGGPRPFNQGPMSPPQMSGPRSPAASYPPPQQQQYQQQQQQYQQQNWAQQQSKPIGQSPYATLPRTNASQQQVSSQISSTTNNEASIKSHETVATSTNSTPTTEQKITHPPTNGSTPKRVFTSGLHKPDNIPQYQRNWTKLQSQRPVRTPEPDELKQNVPLAFVDAPIEKTPTRTLDVPHKNKHHLLRGVSPTCEYSGSVIVNPHMTGPITNNQSLPKQSVPKSIPLIIEERVGPITMTFQSLDDIPDDRSQSSMSRPYTPSHRPAPIIPYYQTPEKLVCEECPSVESRPYDRRSASPFPDRARSPAPGPPQNPLKLIAIHAPRVKDNNGPNLTVPRTPQAGSITTGQSYLGNQMAQQMQQGQVLSNYQTTSQASAQSYMEKPEIMQQETIGDKTIQRKQNECHAMEEKKSEMESQTTTQVGNAQIERRRKVVEEYEHTQSAKTVEIRTQVGKTGFVANQARRLSELDQEISSVAKQSKAISARALNLDFQDTKFPEIKSPLPSTTFPLKPVFPPHDEPHSATYVVPSPNDSKLVGPPPGFLQRFNPQQNHHESATGRSNIESSFSQSSSYATSSVSQSSSLAVQKNSLTSTNSSFTNQDNLNSKLISAIPVPAFKPPMLSIGSNNNTTNSNTNSQEQIVGKSSFINNNTYRPTASTGPAGFKPTQPGAYKSVIQPNEPPMQSFEPPQQQPQQQAQQKPSLASNLTNPNVNLSDSNNASAGPPSGGNKAAGGTFGATSAPKRGRGTLNKAVGPGGRIPTCGCCGTQIRGPFITALGRIWCPEHFMCVNGSCRRPLQDIGFVEEKGDLYCEYCFEKYLAPTCSKCNNKIKGDCLNAIGRHFHPECFTCAYCGKLFGNTPFFLEEGEPYCETDWNEMFTTKCYACGFPVEAGDRWVEALNHNYHSQCFNCTMCKKNLEGTSFYNKGGRPFCKNHAR